MAVYSMMFMGMAPIGSLVAGLLARRLTAPGTIAAGGRFMKVVIIGGSAQSTPALFEYLAEAQTGALQLSYDVLP